MAKQTVGTLAAILSLNSRGFTTGLTKAGGRAKAFTASLKSMTAAVGGFGLALGGLVGVGGLGLMVSRSLKSVDALAKLSDETGIAIATLQGLGHAATLSGTSVGALQKALRFMSKAVGEAVLGISTEAIPAFEAMGITIEDVKGLNMEEAFFLLADGVAAISDPMERAAVRTKIFGRGGADLANLLDSTSVSMKQVIQDTIDMGATMTREGAKGIEDANDSLSTLGVLIGGVSDKLTEQLAPFITAVATSLTEAAKDGVNFGDAIFQGVKKAIGVVATLVDVFNIVKGTIQIVTGVVGMALGAFVAVIEQIIFRVNQLLSVFGLDFDMPIVNLGRELINQGSGSIRAGAANIGSGASGESGDSVERFLNGVQSQSDSEETNDLLREIRDGQARVAVADI